VILGDIKAYLKERRRATLADIALHLGSDPEAVRGMLERWIRKGKVRKLQARASCNSSCTECDPAATEIYEWLESNAPAIEEPITQPHTCRH
jgi:DNA-binding MarR family transcriptional regulator